MNGPVSIEVLRPTSDRSGNLHSLQYLRRDLPGRCDHARREHYVVKADVCNGCMACVPPCPTGSIDNWRTVLKADAYSIDEQFKWDVQAEQNTMAVPAAEDESVAAGASGDAPADASGIEVDTVRGSVVPPWSAANRT